jgi:IS30 family transposase
VTKKKRLGSRRGRQLRALELRREGYSLREIAKALECHHETVRRDLREAAKLSHLPVAKRAPRRPECDSESDSKPDRAKIIQLRSRA